MRTAAYLLCLRESTTVRMSNVASSTVLWEKRKKSRRYLRLTHWRARPLRSKHSLCNRQRPSRFTNRPITPTAISSSGSWMCSTSMNLRAETTHIEYKLLRFPKSPFFPPNSSYRLHASMVILKQRATRNTAFTSAPSTSARAQPNVFLDHFFGDICVTTKGQKWKR